MNPMSAEQAADWEKRRAKGMFVRILEVWLLWSISMIVFTYLFDWFYDGKVEIKYFKIVLYLAFGFFFSCFSWDSSERKYKNYILRKKNEEG